jgi:hypothetical protein
MSNFCLGIRSTHTHKLNRKDGDKNLDQLSFHRETVQHIYAVSLVRHFFSFITAAGPLTYIF